MPAAQSFNLNIELDYWADSLRREGRYSENEIGELQIRLLDDMDRLLDLNYAEEKAFSLAKRSVALIPVSRKDEKRKSKVNKFKLREYRKLQKYHAYMFIGMMLYFVLAGVLNFISKGFLAFLAVGPVEPENLPGLDISFKILLIGVILFYLTPFIRTANRWIVNIYGQLTTSPFYFFFSGACFIFLAYWLNMVMNITLGIFVPGEYLSSLGINKSVFDLTFFGLVLCAYSTLLIRGSRNSHLN